MTMHFVAILVALAASLSTSCAGWHQRRAAARTLKEIEQWIEEMWRCPPAVRDSAPGRVPPDAPTGARVTVRGNIRIGLHDVECWGNELTGCTAYTGPWVLRPAASGGEHLELHSLGGNVVGWLSREAPVNTLTERWLAEVVVTGQLMEPPGPEDRARGRHRMLVFHSLCTIGPAAGKSGRRLVMDPS